MSDARKVSAQMTAIDFMIYSYGGRAQQKIFFKSAENRAAGSLLVGGHHYVWIFCASKLLWF